MWKTCLTLSGSQDTHESRCWSEIQTVTPEKSLSTRVVLRGAHLTLPAWLLGELKVK